MAGIFFASSLLACLAMASLLQPMVMMMMVMMMIIMIMLPIILMATFLQMAVQVEKEEEASNSVAENTREGALDELGKEDSSTIHQMSSKDHGKYHEHDHEHDHDHKDDMRKESVPRRQHLITATVRQMAKKDQLLLIPVTLW